MSDFLKKNCVKSDSNRLSYCKHCRCGFSVDKAALKSYLVGWGISVVSVGILAVQAL